MDTDDDRFWAPPGLPAADAFDQALGQSRLQTDAGAGWVAVNDCCLACREERLADASFIERISVGMLICPSCGNKRCPRASDHRHGCTASNEPGQPGSVYGPVAGG